MNTKVTNVTKRTTARVAAALSAAVLAIGAGGAAEAVESSGASATAPSVFVSQTCTAVRTAAKSVVATGTVDDFDAAILGSTDFGSDLVDAQAQLEAANAMVSASSRSGVSCDKWTWSQGLRGRGVVVLFNAATRAHTDALEARRLEVAVAARDQAADDLAAAATAAQAKLDASAGQVADEATRTALAKVLADIAKNLKAFNADAAASRATVEIQGGQFRSATAKVAAASGAVDSSVQAKAAADAAAGSSGGGGSTGGKPRPGGGGSTGGSGGSGSTGGSTGAGVVTWGANCVNGGRDKFVDGVYVGGTSCAVASDVAAAIAKYQSASATCAAYGSYTSDGLNDLVQYAARFPNAKFTVTQVDSNMVKISVATCLA